MLVIPLQAACSLYQPVELTLAVVGVLQRAATLVQQSPSAIIFTSMHGNKSRAMLVVRPLSSTTAVLMSISNVTLITHYETEMDTLTSVEHTGGDGMTGTSLRDSACGSAKDADTGGIWLTSAAFHSVLRRFRCASVDIVTRPIAVT